MTATLTLEAAPEVSEGSEVHYRDEPWYQTGTKLEGVETAEQAIVAAHMDWDVEKRPCTYPSQDGNRSLVVKDRFVVVRKTDDAPMGVVGSTYVPYNNKNVFAFADHLVGEGGYFKAVGEQQGGRVIFAVMGLRDHVMVNGSDDHEVNLLLRSSHNGSKAVSAHVFFNRILCTNALSLTIRNAPHSWKVAHNTKLETRLEEARNTLQLTEKYTEAWQELTARLVAIRIDRAGLQKLMERLLPERPRRADTINHVCSLFENSQRNGFYGTGWGALNAITEWVGWIKVARTPESRFVSQTDGWAAHFRNRAAHLMLNQAT